MSVVLSRGQRICGHVRIVKPAPVDAGSRLFGDVWVAEDDETRADLWLTVVGEEFLPSIFEFSEFMAEANGMSRMRHPDLVRVGLVDREETYCVVGYEALEGAQLFSDLLLQEKLDANKVMRRALAVAKGLAYLHGKGVCHGVLSPATTFEWEGSTLAWQYGLAQLLDAKTMAEVCRRASDEELFAPEVHRGSVTPRTDVWSWARLVAEMASGLSALEAVNETLDGGQGFEADPKLIALMQECLSADPGGRLADAERIVERLELIRRSGAVVGVPGTLAPPPPKASTGVVPALEAGLPGDSGGYLQLDLDDADVVETGGHRVRQNRPGDSTAALKALAHEELGDSMSLAIDKVLADGGGRIRLDDSDPHLVELAQEAAKDPKLAPFAPRITAPAPPPPDEEMAIDEAAKSQAFAIPRRPGPHGPGPRVMSTVLAVGVLGVVALSFAHVAGERGGVGAVLGSMPELSLPTSEVEAGEDDAASTAATGESGAPSLPEVAVPDLPTPPKDCPRGMVPVSDVACMDVAEFPGLKRIPQVSVTLRQAATLCEGRGARLCTSGEWSRACAGSQKRRFPYGPSQRAEQCNTASVAGFPQETAASGAYAGCVTPDGIYDLVGNVGEWVAEGIAVGGDSSTDIGQATCTAKGRPPKGYVGPDLGFRCCMDR